MARLVALLVLIVAISVVSAYLPEQQCGPHEEWVSCGRPASCELKCNQPAPNICPTICVSRCQCQKGYLRNNLNLCVLFSNC